MLLIDLEPHIPISYRTLDYWIRNKSLPGKPTGSGRYRDYPASNILPLHVMAFVNDLVGSASFDSGVGRRTLLGKVCDHVMANPRAFLAEDDLIFLDQQGIIHSTPVYGYVISTKLIRESLENHDAMDIVMASLTTESDT